MVDSQSLNSVGAPTAAFNFKSGDISGTAAKTSEEKMGQGNEYYAQYREEEFVSDNQFVDRSAQLRATLNSLAMMNVANIIKNNKNINEKEEPKKHKKRVEGVLEKKAENYEQSPED